MENETVDTPRDDRSTFSSFRALEQKWKLVADLIRRRDTQRLSDRPIVTNTLHDLKKQLRGCVLHRERHGRTLLDRRTFCGACHQLIDTCRVRC